MTKRHLLWSLTKRYPLQSFLTILFGFSGALFSGVSTALLVPVVLELVGQKIPFGAAPPVLKTLFAPFDGLPAEYRSLAMALAVVLAIGLRNLTTYLGSLVSGGLQRALSSDLRLQGIDLLLGVNMSYYAKARVGDIVNLLGNEVGRTASTVSNALQVVVTAIAVLVMVGLLVALSWQLTIAATIMFALLVWINQWYVVRSRIFGKQLSTVSRDYSIALLEMLGGMRLVRIAGNEDRESKKLRQLIETREKVEFQSQANSAAITPLTETLSIVILLAIVAFARWLFARDLSVLSAVLLTYLTLLFRLLPLVGQINRLRGNLANTAASVEVVTAFLNRSDKPLMTNGSEPFLGLEQAIRFEAVDFAYDGASDLSLEGIEITVPRGTTLALVGGSGAGKSTLADLLPRFADPKSGRVTIDGRDLREFNLQSLRRSMGVVSQETFLFNDTVGRNIAYACPEATIEEIIQAARRANAWEFIERLPKGLDTPIGDRGVMLSGGQRQRIAIARALLQNPPILILDEATSALDTVSEKLVQQAIEELSRDRTSIVIAHRLSTVQKADQIAVLERGRLVELGSHGALLARGGRYAQLYSMQFAGATQQLATANETFNRTSYELRTRLNITLGALQLLVDDLLDTDQERQELLNESYRSSIRMLSTMELFEDSLQMQKDLFAKGQGERSEALRQRYETFDQVSYNVRTRLNSAIGALRFLVDDLSDSPEETAEMLAEAYETMRDILHILESLEATGNRVEMMS